MKSTSSGASSGSRASAMFTWASWAAGITDEPYRWGAAIVCAPGRTLQLRQATNGSQADLAVFRWPNALRDKLMPRCWPRREESGTWNGRRVRATLSLCRSGGPSLSWRVQLPS